MQVSLPDILEQVEAALEEAQKDLASLGAPPPQVHPAGCLCAVRALAFRPTSPPIVCVSFINLAFPPERDRVSHTPARVSTGTRARRAGRHRRALRGRSGGERGAEDVCALPNRRGSVRRGGVEAQAEGFGLGFRVYKP